MTPSYVSETESLSMGAGVPQVNEEYFEWIDVLESVSTAVSGFCMVELGAGYGRWLVRAAVALRLLKPATTPFLIGVEAEPTHFGWMVAHFRDNDLDPDDHCLVEAAVDRSEGDALFTIGRPGDWYGQAIVPRGTSGYELVTVRTITLSSLLADVERVDLIDLDVQGVELAVLESAIDELDQKVRRVHVGTHGSDLETGLRELFRHYGWFKRYDYGSGLTESTPFGEVAFTDGVQTWINPRFETVSPTTLELANLEAQIVSLERRLGSSRPSVPTTTAAGA
jgi:FkbM family methyltransferase